MSRRKFVREFKIAALRQLEAGKSVAEVARTLEVNPTLLHGWRREWHHDPQQVFPRLGRPRLQENREAELERQQRMGKEVAFRADAALT